jgi:hypothetical protein
MSSPGAEQELSGEEENMNENQSRAAGSNNDAGNQSGANNNSNEESNKKSASNAESNAESNAKSNAENETSANEANPSGVEVAADTDDDSPPIVLGDRWQFTTRKYGDVIGVIYFNDGETAIRILPDGLSNQLIQLDLADGDFAPDLGIIGAPRRLNKGPAVGFAEYMGFRPDQILLSFTAAGQPGPKFKVLAVNATDDRIEVEDDTGARRTLDFGEIGIQEADFQVLMIEPQDEEEETLTPEQLAEEEAKRVRAQLQGAEEAEALGEQVEEDDFLDAQLPEAQAIEIAAMQQSQVIYDETQQKGEMLSDLLSMLDSISQQNPLYIKRTRAIVEMSSALKNSIVKRAADGAPDGEFDPAVHTLDQMLLNKAVPLARPVLNSKRICVYEGSEEETEQQPPIDPKQLQYVSLYDVTENATENLQRQFDLPAGEPGVGTPRWYMALQQYFTAYPLGDAYRSGNFKFDTDAEFFRTAEPGAADIMGLDKNVGITLTTPKNPKKQGREKKQIGIVTKDLNDAVVPLEQSYRRGHGPTFRPQTRGGVELAIPADQAKLRGHVLFPYKTVLTGQLGAIRSSRLWLDIYRAHAVKSWMQAIVESFGGVQSEPDAQQIMYLDVADATRVNIEFAAYLKTILDQIVIKGPGDVAPVKKHLGIEETEPDLAQQEVIYRRVQEVLGSLRTALHSAAEKAAAARDPAVLRPVLPESEFTQRSLDAIRTEKMLDELYKSMAQMTPGYKQVDVAIMALFLKTAQDYFLATIAGNARNVEKERVRMTRKRLREVLDASLQKQVLLETKGAPPVRNPCAHVGALNQIRRVDNDTQRMALLAKFVQKFAPGRADNWMVCSICQQHLICHHEILQIQQFLNPREFDVIQREIVLNYAGGTFGSKHICRNCGLPIAELGFDTSLEFDDDGRPMMGREVLVDKDALEDENLRIALGVPVELAQEITFDTPAKTEFYQVMRVILDVLGVSFDGPTIQQVVEQAESAAASFFVNEKQYRADARKNPKRAPYERYNAMEKIALMAALVLIEIQTHKPDYIVRYVVEGCTPGFRGYPLTEDADPMSAEQSVGVNYIACALTGVVRQGAPWESGFQLFGKLQTRKQNIMIMVVKFLKDLVETTTVQEALEAKREYIREMFGAAAASGRPSEKIPNGFLPSMKDATEAANDAANQPTVPEGVRRDDQTGLGQVQVANAWIREANMYAKETANVILGNPFAETSCCISPLGNPGQFWNEHAMPPLPTRTRAKMSSTRQSVLYGEPYQPRALQPFNATPSENDYFRVFLKLCYRGARRGLSHEIGYDNTCDWCGIKIPSTYLYPDVDKYGNPIVNEDEVRVTFVQQGIEINTQTFQELLDAAHRHTLWRPYRAEMYRSPQQVIDAIGELENPPIPNWLDRIHETEDSLRTLADDPVISEVQIAAKLEPLAGQIEETTTKIQGLLKPKYFQMLDEIITLPPAQVFEIMRTYFMVPAQRILMRISKEDYAIPKRFKLSEQHSAELTTILTTHTAYINLADALYETTEDADGDEVYTNGLAQQKMKNFVDDVSAILKQSEELRISRVRFSVNGGAQNTQRQMPIQVVTAFLKELVRVLVIGTLGHLLDSDINPRDDEGDEVEMDAGNSYVFMVDFVEFMLEKYSKERLSYNPQEVRQRIEAAKEAEKQRFISDLDRLTEDERRVELMKKRYGIGRWAIGGTKLVWQYDRDQWDKNREELQRNYAGAVGAAEGMLPMPGGPEFDADGFPVDPAAGEGYDVNQHPGEDEE